MIYDFHCHLDLMQNMNQIISECSNKNIGILAVGTTPKAYEKEFHICSKYDNIFVAAGIHPQLIKTRFNELELAEHFISISKYVGEVGLDFSKNHVESKYNQILVFERVVSICEKCSGKIVSIHAVKSVQTVLDILNKNITSRGNAYIIHWFSGTLSQLKKAEELGCYFSVNPRMLKTQSGRNIIKEMNPERMLVETDAPFTMEVNSVDDISNAITKTISGISHLLGYDIKDVIEKNSMNVINHKENIGKS